MSTLIIDCGVYQLIGYAVHSFYSAQRRGLLHSM